MSVLLFDVLFVLAAATSVVFSVVGLVIVSLRILTEWGLKRRQERLAKEAWGVVLAAIITVIAADVIKKKRRKPRCSTCQRRLKGLPRLHWIGCAYRLKK